MEVKSNLYVLPLALREEDSKVSEYTYLTEYFGLDNLMHIWWKIKVKNEGAFLMQFGLATKLQFSTFCFLYNRVCMSISMFLS